MKHRKKEKAFWLPGQWSGQVLAARDALRGFRDEEFLLHFFRIFLSFLNPTHGSFFSWPCMYSWYFLQNFMFSPTMRRIAEETETTTQSEGVWERIMWIGLRFRIETWLVFVVSPYIWILCLALLPYANSLTCANNNLRKWHLPTLSRRKSQNIGCCYSRF